MKDKPLFVAYDEYRRDRDISYYAGALAGAIGMLLACALTGYILIVH